MKTKTIIFSLILILLLGITGAYVIGDIITQTQLDSKDVSKIHFDIGVNRIEKQSKNVYVWFNYTTLKRLGDEYEVVEKEGHTFCSLKVYTNCRLKDNLPKADCINVMKTCLRTNVIKLRERERKMIENWQTKTAEDELNPEDIDLGDLNA